MVNVFGDNVASGPRNLQMVKKVVVTVGKFKDYMDEIQLGAWISTLQTTHECRRCICYPHSCL